MLYHGERYSHHQPSGLPIDFFPEEGPSLSRTHCTLYYAPLLSQSIRQTTSTQAPNSEKCSMCSPSQASSVKANNIGCTVQ